jgi:D-glycero-alpha-D-manno-heptose-7-phosphate kinase
MIITSTPFRISFSGGGSDLVDYYSQEPGVVLSTAIDKYMYLAVKPHFDRDFRVSYSKTEHADTVDQIEHGIVRECLKLLGIDQGCEIVSMADLPARTGLGSSSSFTVGLLHALYAHQGKVVSPDRLAAEACRIEIEKLGEPIGKQDQYIAAYGGMQLIQFNPDGTVFVNPVACTVETRRQLNQRLVMFFVGGARDARDILARQKQSTRNRMEALRVMCRIAHQLHSVIVESQSLKQFGLLLHEAWQAKKTLEPSISNPQIDEYYARGLRSGALGGKLLGAGGGGFLLFYCEPEQQDSLRRELAELRELPFSFEAQGSRIVHIGSGRW